MKFYKTDTFIKMTDSLTEQVRKLQTDFSNITPSIYTKLGRSLHNVKNHPIEICKRLIYDYFTELSKTDDYSEFKTFDTLCPIVNTENNFDRLLIGPDHPSRGRSDTYYINENTVLRTHTSAHQHDHLCEGLDNFLVTGDVYRKDEVNATHYPVFHQLEGVAKVPKGKDPVDELKRVLSGLVEHLFPGHEYRFNDDYFPFTDPSLEVEVEFNGEWLEILGCGITHKDILKSTGRDSEGDWWAFGLGLERLCMILFQIKDIRYFWLHDNRFINQFKSGKVVKFQHFSSNLKTELKDISFWIDSDQLTDQEAWTMENDFMGLVRDVCGDFVKDVSIKDAFTNKKTGKHSKCYRITLLPIDTSMNDPTVFKTYCIDAVDKIKSVLNANPKFNVEIR